MPGQQDLHRPGLKKTKQNKPKPKRQQNKPQAENKTNNNNKTKQQTN